MDMERNTFEYELEHWYIDADAYLTRILGKETANKLMHYEILTAIISYIDFYNVDHDEMNKGELYRIASNMIISAGGQDNLSFELVEDVYDMTCQYVSFMDEYKLAAINFKGNLTSEKTGSVTRKIGFFLQGWLDNLFEGSANSCFCSKQIKSVYEPLFRYYLWLYPYAHIYTYQYIGQVASGVSCEEPFILHSFEDTRKLGELVKLYNQDSTDDLIMRIMLEFGYKHSAVYDSREDLFFELVEKGVEVNWALCIASRIRKGQKLGTEFKRSMRDAGYTDKQIEYFDGVNFLPTMRFYLGYMIYTYDLVGKHNDLNGGYMCKGIFWITDVDNIYENKTFFLIPCDDAGMPIGEMKLNSKNNDNLNHKLTWDSLPSSVTNNKPYNFYPRGRVEIKKGRKAVIYLNPKINNPEVISWVIDKYGLSESEMKIDVKSDGSDHYKCYMDLEQG